MPNTRGVYEQPFWSSTTGLDGTGNFSEPRPSFTYTKTFSSPLSSETTNTGVVAAPSFKQYGSELMLIDGFGGGVPCSVTTPVIALAVAGSTGSVSGAAAFDAVDSSLAPPPQAA